MRELTIFTSNSTVYIKRCMKYCYVILFVFISSSLLFAQTSRENAKSGTLKKDLGATYKVETSASKKKKINNSIAKDFDRKVEEYEKRMEQNAKRNEKVAKEMKKPQYADPTYFGHKKKPKKRPPGKKKFCRECQMYH